MGRDKAFLELDGIPFIQHVIRAVAPVADELLVVIGDRPTQEFASLGCRLLPDAVPGIGTFGGVYTAIAEAAFDHTLIVGCDTPLLSTELMSHLAARPRTYDALVPSVVVEDDDGGETVEILQPLHAIYARRCLGVLKERIAQRQLRVVDALGVLQVERVQEDELRRFDPELHSFLNANTPQELARVQAVRQERSSSRKQ